jgi:hypothetical protein
MISSQEEPQSDEGAFAEPQPNYDLDEWEHAFYEDPEPEPEVET